MRFIRNIEFLRKLCRFEFYAPKHVAITITAQNKNKKMDVLLVFEE